jgi:SAM-dependent methyltransferase
VAGVRAFIPKRVRSWLNDRYYAVVDVAERLTGSRDPLVPPKRLLRISTDPAADFIETGKAVVRLMVDACDLRPSDVVLDVGCGVGRIALPLARLLVPPGRYEGFDIVPAEVEWCRTHITPRFPHARFQLADVFNEAYNPSGTRRAAEYRFAYDDQVFDQVVVSSVFTHLLADDLAHYLSEVARVMKRGGRCLASFYLLNERTRRDVANGSSCFAFTHRIGTAAVHDPDSPEWAVAHDEDVVREACARHGLTISAAFYGEWSRSSSQAQDLFVLRRE